MEKYSNLARDKYSGYMHRELEKAFEKVANPNDWKSPIVADIAGGANMNLTIAAIEYFTATEPITKISQTPGNVIIMSEGYRMGPAGDR